MVEGGRNKVAARGVGGILQTGGCALVAESWYLDGPRPCERQRTPQNGRYEVFGTILVWKKRECGKNDCRHAAELSGLLPTQPRGHQVLAEKG